MTDLGRGVFWSLLVSESYIQKPLRKLFKVEFKVLIKLWDENNFELKTILQKREMGEAKQVLQPK